MRLWSPLFSLAFAIGALASSAYGAETAPVAPKQFLGILHLTPRLYSDTAWTKEDQAAVGRHFERLKAAAGAGQVILAGRTNEPGDKTMGLVIFEAADLKEATTFMAQDPAVVAGVMTFDVRPYQVAVMRK